MDKFAQLLVNGLLVGLLYSLVALGFVLIRKGSGIINFAQGELILVAGYLVAWFLTDFGLHILVAVAASMGLMALLGLSWSAWWCGRWERGSGGASAWPGRAWGSPCAALVLSCGGHWP